MIPVGQGQVHGVPAFWGASPGNSFGALMFRAGHADEMLPRRGITHLVEHLTLHPFDHRTMSYNAFVDLTTTVFHCQGTPEQVGAFLTNVARSLAALPFDRLEKEAQVLRAEAAQRRGSAVATALMLRCGPMGFGVVEYEELFLHQPTAGTIDEWRRRYFTRQNAVLVLSTMPPPNLDLSALPDGQRMPPPPYLPVEQAYPAWSNANTTSVGLSFVLPRSVAVPAALYALTSTLRTLLREQLAVSYDVGSDTQLLSATHAHHLLYADCRPADAAEVMARMRTELSRVIHDGCPPADLDDYRQVLARYEREPGAGLGAAHHHAYEMLFKGAPPDMAEIDRDVAALQPADIARTVEQIVDSALWLVPNNTPVRDQRVRLVEQWSRGAVNGTTHTQTAPENNGNYLISASNGVSLAVRERGYVTLLFDRLAACKAWADGARTLFGLDGFAYTMHPDDWTGGQQLTALIDRQVAPSLMVHCADRLRPPT